MKRFTMAGLVAGTVLLGVSALNAATVNQRRENQQDRIAQGVGSGQLTAREAAHLETKESRLNRQIHTDRADHNGHLTAGERARVNHEQNRVSRDIYRDKHNGFHQ